jgi:hypothetical protein
MHFIIPYAVPILDIQSAEVVFSKTLKEAYATSDALYGEDNAVDVGQLEVKIDGNRILFKAKTAEGEWAWLEADKIKD